MVLSIYCFYLDLNTQTTIQMFPCLHLNIRPFFRCSHHLNTRHLQSWYWNVSVNQIITVFHLAYLYPWGWSTQVASLWQGELAHSSTLISHLGPVNPAGQKHLGRWLTATQRPPCSQSPEKNIVIFTFLSVFPKS